MSAHQTKRRRGNHFQFIFLLFFPFTSSSLFSFSAGEVIIAVFPLESCHHSRSNSLSFTHYLHSSIHPSSSFTRNNFTHSSLFSLSICVFLSLSNSLNREKESSCWCFKNTLDLFPSNSFWLFPFLCSLSVLSFALILLFFFFLTCFNPNSLSLPFCSCSLC